MLIVRLCGSKMVDTTHAANGLPPLVRTTESQAAAEDSSAVAKTT